MLSSKSSFFLLLLFLKAAGKSFAEDFLQCILISLWNFMSKRITEYGNIFEFALFIDQIRSQATNIMKIQEHFSFLSAINFLLLFKYIVLKS